MKLLGCLRSCALSKRNTATAFCAALMVAVVIGLPIQSAAQTPTTPPKAEWTAGHTIVNPPVKFDHSAPLPQLFTAYKIPPRPTRQRQRRRSTTAPVATPMTPPPPPTISAESAALEQVTQGSSPAATLITSFDGLGVGFDGPQGKASGRNPSDNSLGVGKNEIVQIVNSHMAIFTRKGKKYPETGKALFGPVITNALFAGFGGPCEKLTSGDAVVRYDQLANRWLFVLPIFRHPADQPDAPYGMCYAISTSPDAMGSYYRYQFNRPLFPDYPRPAIWRDAYYIPTSTGDTVIQKQLCAVDRNKMLKGQSADEQCVIIDGVSFLNAADIDGKRLPPPGSPELVMADGGTQLHKIFEDDGIYVWKYHVNWDDPSKTRLSGPEKITVAPYHFLCNGQLSKCVPQPGTDVRLDSQGDKLMQRLVYRNFGDHQSIVASHSIDTKDGGGGVRWYEFRLDGNGEPQLYQQGTYAPGGNYRWMPSIAMDRNGDIGVGYSFGGASEFPGQRFAARFANDPKGEMTVHEAVVAKGEASQNTVRWEDYTTLDIDPSDDCTFWYVGDYLKTGEQNYSTRIGAFRLSGCTPRRKLFGLF